MNIDVQWHHAIPLRECSSREPLIYALPKGRTLTDGPGCYIFARKHGTSVAPLYIGKAANLGKRIEQQLQFVRLMKGIQQMPSGQRVLLLGELRGGRGLRTSSALQVLEAALIEHALSEGHELLNKQGTHTPVHSITNRGNRISRSVAPLRMKRRK